MVSDLPIVGLRDECERICSAIEERRSLLVLGSPGCGKTKVLRWMLRESGLRFVYLDAASVPHKLLVELCRALIEAGHSPLRSFVPAGDHACHWLHSQTSLHLRGILLSALEAEPRTIVLDHICNASAQTYRFLQKVYVGYPLDSCNPPASGLVGRSPWTARDALVPLPEAEAGASERARAPAPRDAANCAGMSQVDTQQVYYTRGIAMVAVSRRSRDLGFLDRLFWDPRETVTFEPLPQRDALQLFNMLVREFELDTFDVDDFRRRVLEAARGNPGQITHMCELAANPSYRRGQHILFAPLRIDTATRFMP